MKLVQGCAVCLWFVGERSVAVGVMSMRDGTVLTCGALERLVLTTR
jgi:hypothetical protein